MRVKMPVDNGESFGGCRLGRQYERHVSLIERNLEHAAAEVLNVSGARKVERRVDAVTGVKLQDRCMVLPSLLGRDEQNSHARAVWVRNVSHKSGKDDPKSPVC